MVDSLYLTREQIEEFIRIYQENPCIWKIKSKDYMYKHKKNAIGVLQVPSTRSDKKYDYKKNSVTPWCF